MSVSMLGSTTTLLVDTNEFMTGSVIGCNAEGSIFSSFKLVVDNTVSDEVGVKGNDEPEAVEGSKSAGVT